MLVGMPLGHVHVTLQYLHRVWLPLLFILLSLQSTAEPAVFNTLLNKRNVANFYLDSKDPQPYKPIGSPTKNSTIFVEISSFRDEECGNSLFNFFSKAANPARVFVGVVEQLAPEDYPVNCLEDYCKLINKHTGRTDCPWKDHVKITSLTAEEARGPVYARSFQDEMMTGQEFCLQTDAHTQTMDNWDVDALAEWRLADDEYAVLSTYPSGLETKERDERRVKRGDDLRKYEVPHLCYTEWGGHGMVRNGQACSAENLPRPVRGCLWGAGLSFSKCHAELAVKYDPYLPGIWDGEEFSKAVRLWTHGYDLYSPSRNFVFHHYGRNAKGHIGKASQADVEKSYVRLKTVLEMPGGNPALLAELGEYGLGNKRTVAQYQELCRIGLSTKEAMSGSNAGLLRWIPWKEDAAQRATRLGASRHNSLSEAEIHNLAKRLDGRHAPSGTVAPESLVELDSRVHQAFNVFAVVLLVIVALVIKEKFYLSKEKKKHDV